MSHLLAISIGPVQEFIAAARRTADLYAGSQILQEVCKAAAQALGKQGAELIFPSSAQADGANKILAILDGDPEASALYAESAAKDKLTSLWSEARKTLPSGAIDEKRAKLQLEGFLEFYAAWLPFDGSDYPGKRQQVDRLLAGRKALRDFEPVDQNDDGVPKSPLDPSRASVIDPRRWSETGVPVEGGGYRPLRLKPTEHLDALSLLKRVYGVRNSGQVVDTRTLARRAERPEAMPDERYGEDDDHLQEAQPYFAILVADGDKMGDLISQKKTPEEHQGLSADLDKFAKQAQEIVRRHLGFPVYTGGDDVLALLPVNQAVACAEELYKEFIGTVEGGTLSAGVAIVHYREPLSISLEAARDAEKAAKDGGRNALAVALHTRGGAPLTVVRSWEELRQRQSNLSWDDLINAYKLNKVSRGLAYELEKLAREWPRPIGKEDEQKLWIEATRKYLREEAKRILDRKEGSQLELPELPDVKALQAYADQLVIARFLSGIQTSDIQEAAHA